MLDGKIETLHFDEAWLPHATFHEFYRGMHAIGEDRPRCKESMIFSTQSMHKLLAGLSQASQILVQDSEKRMLNLHAFNESYHMHTSTSPQYAIIASCDVAAAMMEPPGGTALVEESISRSARLPPRDAQGRTRSSARTGGSRCGAPSGSPPKASATATTGCCARTSAGTASAISRPGFNMLDPIKATIITPGLDVTGKFARDGIPAIDRHALSRRARHHRGEDGLYSFFIMFTIGITKGRWNTLVTELQQFKDDYDRNAPLWRVMPEFLAKLPRYEKIGLRELCDAIHAATGLVVGAGFVGAYIVE